MEFKAHQRRGQKLPIHFTNDTYFRHTTRTFSENMSNNDDFSLVIEYDHQTRGSHESILRPRSPRELGSGPTFKPQPKKTWLSRIGPCAKDSSGPFQDDFTIAMAFHTTSEGSIASGVNEEVRLCLRMNQATNPFVDDKVHDQSAYYYSSFDGSLARPRLAHDGFQSPHTPQVTYETLPSVPPPCMPTREEHEVMVCDSVPSRVMLPEFEELAFRIEKWGQTYSCHLTLTM